jgi:hypothetical protein
MFNSIVQGFLNIWRPSGVTSTTVDDAEDAVFTSTTTEEMPSDLVDTEWPLLGQHLEALRQLSEEYDDPYLFYRLPITSQFELDKFVRRLQTHWPHIVQYRRFDDQSGHGRRDMVEYICKDKKKYSRLKESSGHRCSGGEGKMVLKRYDPPKDYEYKYVSQMLLVFADLCHCDAEGKGHSKCMHSASTLSKLIRDQVRINPYCTSTELMCTIKQRLEDRKDCDDRTLWYYHNRYGNETVQKQVRRAKKLVTREIWGDSTILKYLKFLDEYVKLSDVDNEFNYIVDSDGHYEYSYIIPGFGKRMKELFLNTLVVDATHLKTLGYFSQKAGKLYVMCGVDAESQSWPLCLMHNGNESEKTWEVFLRITESFWKGKPINLLGDEHKGLISAMKKLDPSYYEDYFKACRVHREGNVSRKHGVKWGSKFKKLAYSTNSLHYDLYSEQYKSEGIAAAPLKYLKTGDAKYYRLKDVEPRHIMTGNPVEQVNSVPGLRTVKFVEACHARSAYGPISLLKYLTHFMHKLQIVYSGKSTRRDTLSMKAEKSFMKSLEVMHKRFAVLEDYR